MLWKKDSGAKKRIDPRHNADPVFASEIIRTIINNAYRYVYGFAADPLIPLLRPRIEDHESFIRVRKEYDRWYAEYKKLEAPFIR